MGQYPISFKKIDGVWYAPDDIKLIGRLSKLKDQKKPNIKLRNKYLTYFKTYNG